MSLNRFLFLRMGCTLEVTKYHSSGEFEPDTEEYPVETTLKFGSGIGINIVKSITVNASFKRHYQKSYFGITITYRSR